MALCSQANVGGIAAAAFVVLVVAGLCMNRSVRKTIEECRSRSSGKSLPESSVVGESVLMSDSAQFSTRGLMVSPQTEDHATLALAFGLELPHVKEAALRLDARPLRNKGAGCRIYKGQYQVAPE